MTMRTCRIFGALSVPECVSHCLFLRLGWTFNFLRFWTSKSDMKIRAQRLCVDGTSHLCKNRSRDNARRGSLLHLQEVNRISKTFFFFSSLYKILNGIRWFPRIRFFISKTFSDLQRLSFCECLSESFDLLSKNVSKTLRKNEISFVSRINL